MELDKDVSSSTEEYINVFRRGFGYTSKNDWNRYR